MKKKQRDRIRHCEYCGSTLRLSTYMDGLDTTPRILCHACRQKEKRAGYWMQAREEDPEEDD